MLNEDSRSLEDPIGRSISLGVFCVTPSSLVTEALSAIGFDWICIDRQHGVIGYETMAAMLQVATSAGVAALVRVAGNDPTEIGRALDAGASGVIVPSVNSAAEADRAVRAVRYPPRGDRSWAPRRAWQAHRPEDDVSRLYVMLETEQGFANAGSIISTPGIDGIFVGPSDMAISLGLAPSAVMDPAIQQRCEQIVRLCVVSNIEAGIGAHSTEHALAWSGLGFRMLSVGRDLTAMTDQLRERLGAFHDRPSRA